MKNKYIKTFESFNDAVDTDLEVWFAQLPLKARLKITGIKFISGKNESQQHDAEAKWYAMSDDAKVNWYNLYNDPKRAKLFENSYLENSYNGEYVNITILPNSLKIELTGAGREYLEENEITDQNFGDMVEDITINSDMNYHTDLGEDGFGLTSACGITFGYYTNNEGKYDGDGDVFYDNNYAISDFVETLKQTGEYHFNKA